MNCNCVLPGNHKVACEWIIITDDNSDNKWVRVFLYPPLQRSWKGGILVSPCPSVRLSVCGQNRVRSVSSTILIGSISYLHILSSNFRRCVACNARFKIQNFEILANFFKFVTLTLTLTLTFVFFWLVVFGQFPPLPLPSTVQDRFFPYLVQMINSMRGCVACDDLWPWPISSRSFGLDLENPVRFVASTVLDQFFLYLAQMITIIRGCVACDFFFRIWKFEFLANFWNFSALILKKKIYSSRWILSIFSTNDH